MTAEDLRAELIAQLNSEPYMTPAETVDGVMVVLDRLGVIDHANNHASSHASEHAAAAEDLRDRIRESFGPAMKLGLQDAELFDEPGAERVEEWITYITDWVTAAVSPEVERLRAELAEAREWSTELGGHVTALREMHRKAAAERDALNGRLDQLRAYARWCNDRSVEPEARDILDLADGACHEDYVALMAADAPESNEDAPTGEAADG